MPDKSNILFLTLNTFSSTGGIEDVCKTFCKVLSNVVPRFLVYSMNDDEPEGGFIAPERFTGFRGNKIYFGFKAIISGLDSETIVLSHVNLLLFARIIKIIAPQKRIIMYAHGIEVWRNLPAWKIKFLQNYVEIWAVSNHTSNDLQKRHKIPVERIRIVNNCLNPFFDPPINFEKPTQLLRRYRLSADQPVLFTLTRIKNSEKYKGYDIVINILPKLIKIFPNLQYIISGKADSKERDRLVKLIKKQGLQDHVFLSGFVSYRELQDHFLLADCFVLPSKKEGFGIVFIESAACGCEVLAGNKDGSKDALLDGELGTLINPDNKDEVFESLKKILQKPQSLENKKKIQQKCLEHFSFAKYSLTIRNLLFPNSKVYE